MTHPNPDTEKPKTLVRRVWDWLTGGGGRSRSEVDREREERIQRRIERAGAMTSREAAKMIGSRGPFDRTGGIALHRQIMAGEVTVIRADGTKVPVPADES